MIHEKWIHLFEKQKMCIFGWVVLSLNIQDALILEGLGSQQFISSFLSYFSVRGIPDGSQ